MKKTINNAKFNIGITLIKYFPGLKKLALKLTMSTQRWEDHIRIFDQYPDVVTVDQLAQMLNIGKSSSYALLQTNQIRHVRVGRKYIIPKKSIVEFLNGACYNDCQIINGRLNQQSPKGVSL